MRRDRTVALKVVLPELLNTKGLTERVKAAVRAAMALEHPHIATTHSVEEIGGLLILVTNLVEGASLEAILRFESTLAIPAVQSVLVQVAAALDYAHDEGVIHGGVKPGNVMVSLAGDAIVTDFGFAHALGARAASEASPPTLPPAYLSPEQIRGGSVYASSDQYSLGVIAFEMLVGKPPFTGTMADVRNGHLNKKPPAISNPEIDIPPEISSAVMRMLAKAPSERFPSLGDATVELAFGMSDYEDSPRGPLSWLAQQNMPRESEGGAGTAARGWRGIPLTPLPLPVVEPPPTPTVARPAIDRTPHPAIRAEPDVAFAPAAEAAPSAFAAAAASASALLTTAGVTPPVPATAAGTAARAQTPLQAQRAALAAASTRRRKVYATVGAVVVTISGLAAWQTFAGRTRLRSVAVAAAPAELATALPDTNAPPTVVTPPPAAVPRATVPPNVPVAKTAPAKSAPARTTPPKIAPPKSASPKEVPTKSSTTKSTSATGAAAVRQVTASPKAASPTPTSATAPVVPPQPTVASVTLSGERRELVAGESMRLQARVMDSQNQAMPRAAVSWRSSNSDIAEVDAAGLVVAKRRGSVRITAMVESRSDELQLEVKDVEVAPAPPPATLSAPAPRVETPRPSPRLTDGEAERVARSIAERVRADDVDGLTGAMAGSKADRDFVAWLRKKPLDLQVGAARATSVTQQPDGSARVTYSVPVSWTHASGARPVRTATFSVVVGGAGTGARVTGWSLASPFVP